MTAPARTRSRSRTSTRRPAQRASRGGSAPIVVVLGTVAAIAVVVGALVSVFFLRPTVTEGGTTARPAGSPAAEVALPSENNPGPVRMDGMIPSGFTTGPTGATAAAAAYGQLASQLAVMSDNEVRAVGRKVVGPRVDAQVAVVTPVETLRKLLNARDSSTVRVTPLGRRVTALSSTRATIDVWESAMIATPGGIATGGGTIEAPTEAVFFVATVDVVWTGTDWKVQALRFANGPTPALGTNAPKSAEGFTKDFTEYRPFGYLPPVEGSK